MKHTPCPESSQRLVDFNELLLYMEPSVKELKRFSAALTTGDLNRDFEGGKFLLLAG